MFGTGFLAGLLAKLAGLGSMAKLAVATATVGTPATSSLSTSSSSSASTGSSAAGTSASNPAAPASRTGLADVSGLTQVPGQVLACLTPILDLVKSLPTAGVGGGEITRIGPTVVACVTGIVKALPLPSGLSTCVSQILTFVRGLAAQAPTGVPDLGGLDLASCIPAGLPVPGMPGGLPFMGGGFPFGG